VTSLNRIAPIGEWRDAVYGLKSVNELLQAGAQTLISSAHVGPQSVATPFGNDVGNKDRARWGSRHKRDVSVPTSVLAALGAIKFKNFRMIGVARHNRMSRGRFADGVGQGDLFAMR
jgi:hypothetical protein